MFSTNKYTLVTINVLWDNYIEATVTFIYMQVIRSVCASLILADKISAGVRCSVAAVKSLTVLHQSAGPKFNNFFNAQLS